MVFEEENAASLLQSSGGLVLDGSFQSCVPASEGDS